MCIRDRYSEAFDLGGLLGEADNRVLGGGPVASAEMEHDEPATAAEPAAPPAPDPADSSLGKRGRDGSDDESDEEESVPWRAAPPSRGNAFSLLATDDAEEEEPEPEPAPQAPARPAGQSDRQLFSAEELEGMALSRGAARRKARKESKKRRREGELTGAVNTFMELGAEGEEDPMDNWDAGDAWDAPVAADGAVDGAAGAAEHGAAGAAADNNPILDPASLKAGAPARSAPDAVQESDEEL